MTEIDLSALEADLEALPPKGSGQNKCKVQMLVALHPEAAATLKRAIGDLRWSPASVAAVLTKNGLPISESTIRKHRNNECSICNPRTVL